MIAGMIRGATRFLGRSQGFHELPVRDTVAEDGTPYMESVWFPSPDEVAKIVRGAPVLLTLIGTGHPPVRVDVGDLPEPLEGDML